MKYFTNKKEIVTCKHCGSTDVKVEVIHNGHTNYRCNDCNVLETDHTVDKDN